MAFLRLYIPKFSGKACPQFLAPPPPSNYAALSLMGHLKAEGLLQ